MIETLPQEPSECVRSSTGVQIVAAEDAEK
jgi:hypothetical protein